MIKPEEPAARKQSSSGAIPLAIALLILPLMPSQQSLWIDEAYTAAMVKLPSFTALLHEFYVGRDSHHQMPLGMGFAWAAAKVFGTTEWGLRAPNIIWGVIAIVALYFAGKTIGLSWLPLLCALHPFFWHYMDEARPYAMQIAGGSLLCLAVLQLTSSKGTYPLGYLSLAAGACLLAGSSLVGMLPTLVTVCGLAYCTLHDRWRIPHRARKYLALTAGALFVLGLFYLWTLSKGAGATRGRNAGFSSPIFAVYELAGFAGFGPARDEIRQAALTSFPTLWHCFVPFLLPLLLLAVTYIALVSQAQQRSLLRQPAFQVCVAVIVITLTILTIASVSVGWPFWGRHASGVFPFALAAVGFAFATVETRGRRAVAIALLTLLTCSSFSLRVLAYHRRDDYRGAAAIALQAAAVGEEIWWVADPAAGAYYHTFSNNNVRPIVSPKRGELADGAASPRIIIVSKRDLFDRAGAVGEYITDHGYRLTQHVQGFDVFERPGS